MAIHKPQIKLTDFKDYLFITFGLMLYAVGFSAFILPHKIVMGGLTGLGTFVYFISDGRISVAVTTYVCNLALLSMAFKLVGRTFVIRTIFSATVIALSIGYFENFFMAIGHPLIADISMSAILGAILSGLGVGIAFLHNGSTGGTDIIAAMVSKVSNASLGRTMMAVDLCIVSTSLWLPFDGTFGERLEARVPVLVYGMVVTFVVAYVVDQVVNSNRQATQFIIFSKNWKEIADAINTEARRGVTVLDGMGWYTKKDMKILMVWCRKIESVNIFRIVKSIDENAFITQGAVNGVYGHGFDTMRVKMKDSRPK